MRGRVAKTLRELARLGGPPSGYHRRYARLKRNWKSMPGPFRSLATVRWLIGEAKASIARRERQRAEG